MSETLAVIFFGWPAILAALTCSGIGLLGKRWPWLLVGAALMTPPAWFFSGYPAIRWAAFFLPLFLLASAFAVRKRKFNLAWFLALPVIAASAWLAVLVLLQ